MATGAWGAVPPAECEQNCNVNKDIFTEATEPRLMASPLPSCRVQGSTHPPLVHPSCGAEKFQQVQRSAPNVFSESLSSCVSNGSCDPPLRQWSFLPQGSESLVCFEMKPCKLVSPPFFLQWREKSVLVLEAQTQSDTNLALWHQQIVYLECVTLNGRRVLNSETSTSPAVPLEPLNSLFLSRVDDTKRRSDTGSYASLKLQYSAPGE